MLRVPTRLSASVCSPQVRVGPSPSAHKHCRVVACVHVYPRGCLRACAPRRVPRFSAEPATTPSPPGDGYREPCVCRYFEYSPIEETKSQHASFSLRGDKAKHTWRPASDVNTESLLPSSVSWIPEVVPSRNARIACVGRRFTLQIPDAWSNGWKRLSRNR